jgi:hypothetical protein
LDCRRGTGYAGLFEHAELAVGPGAGRFAWFDDPASFRSRLAAFLADHVEQQLRGRRSGSADLFDLVGEVEAAALSNRAQLLEVILQELARLVPCDRAVCGDWDPEGPPGTTATDPECQQANASSSAHLRLPRRITIRARARHNVVAGTDN